MKLPLKDNSRGNMNTNKKINSNLGYIKYIFEARISFLMIALLIFLARKIACCSSKSSLSSIHLAYITFPNYGVRINLRTKKICNLMCDLHRFCRFKKYQIFNLS